MENARRTVFIGVCVAALLVALVSAGAYSTAAASGISDEDIGIDGTVYGHSAPEFVFMWGGVSNGWGQFLTSEIDSQVGLSDEELTADELQLFLGETRTYDRPPGAAQKWNNRVYEQYEDPDADKFRSTSIYPDAAELQSGEMVKDAHATVFSISPRTRVHTAEEAVHYIGRSGEVQAFTDFRPNRPEIDIGYENDYRVVNVDTTWTNQEARINETRLLADGTELASTRNENSPEFSYDSLDRDTERLTVESEMKTRYRVEIRTTEEEVVDLPTVPMHQLFDGPDFYDIDYLQNRYGVPEDGDSSRYGTVQDADVVSRSGSEVVEDDPDGVSFVDLGEVTVHIEHEEERTFSETMNVSDSQSVRVYDPQSPDLTIGEAGESDMTMVSSQEPISGYSVEAQPESEYSFGPDPSRTTHTLDYGWRFYTSRDPQWDTMHVTNGSATTSNTTLMSPVSVNAIQTGTVEGEPTPSGPTDIRATTDNYGQASSPRNGVKVPNQANEYAVPTTVSASHGTQIDPDGESKYYGLVRGTNGEISSDNIRQESFEQTNLSLEFEQQDGDPVAKVTVTNAETGQPIPGSQLGGELTIASGADKGETVSVSESGVATHELPTYGPVTATYEPEPWETSSTPRTGATARDRVSQFDQTGYLWGLILEIIQFVLLPALVLKLIASGFTDMFQFNYE